MMVSSTQKIVSLVHLISFCLILYIVHLPVKHVHVQWILDVVVVGLIAHHIRMLMKTSTPSAPPTEKSDRRMESSDQKLNRPTGQGLQILLARYGTTHKDVDVTDTLRKIVSENDGILHIPADMNFNQRFSDPHRFRRKKLRFVATVDGSPVAHFLREHRTKDFVLSPSIHPKECDENDENDDASKDIGSDEDATKSAGPSNLASLTTSHPIVRDIHRNFSILKDQLPFRELEVDDLMQACDGIGSMIDLFGASMLSVRASITDNLTKIRKQMALRSGETESRIGVVILEEKRTGTMKREGSVCLSSLWLKRSLDFMAAFLEAVLNGERSSEAAIAAYKRTLEPWQGWVVRTACKTGMRLVPKRATILRVLRDSGRGDDDEQALISELKMMMGSFSAVVISMDNFFEKNDLDFPEKC